MKSRTGLTFGVEGTDILQPESYQCGDTQELPLPNAVVKSGTLHLWLDRRYCWTHRHLENRHR